MTIEDIKNFNIHQNTAHVFMNPIYLVDIGVKIWYNVNIPSYRLFSSPNRYNTNLRIG